MVEITPSVANTSIVFEIGIIFIWPNVGAGHWRYVSGAKILAACNIITVWLFSYTQTQYTKASLVVSSSIAIYYLSKGIISHIHI
jgi:hypothetical protein